MDDLISRQAAIEVVSKGCAEFRGVFERCENNILSLPSAQAEPKEQRRGEWIDEKINSYTSRTYCSECGNSAPFICVSSDHYGRNMRGEVKKTKFCPSCGAAMREESDNEIH